jgi:hypothetical protein
MVMVWVGVLTIVHVEPRFSVSAIPSGQSMAEGGLAIFGILDLPVLLMHEHAAYRTGTRVHVLVRAPSGKVDAPLM